MIFLMVPNVEIAIERVATRVAQGGHAVPETIIRRRYTASLRNFEEIYKGLVDVRKMAFRYSLICGTTFDAVDAVKLEIPKGFKFWEFKSTEFLKNIIRFNHI